MIPKGENGGFTPRNNPYAGPQELKLKQVLKTNFANLTDAEKSWSDGAADLVSLNEKLAKQKSRIELEYQSPEGTDNPGREAARTYQRLIDIVDRRRGEMTDVAEAVKKAKEATSTAWTEYNTLPVVSEPAADNPTAGITGHSKKAIEKRTEAVKAAEKENETHASSVNAAEAKARQVLATLDSEMEQATDKMRKVAGTEKPGSVTNASTTADVSPGSGRPTQTNPGVVRQPRITQTSTVTEPTHTTVVNPGPHTDVNDPPILQSDQTTDHNSGLLQSSTPPVTSSPPTTTVGPTAPTSSGPTPAGVNPVVTPGLSTSAVSRTPGTAVPGSTAARSSALGRSSTSAASRGVLGRNTMMPGQSAAGRTGATAARSGTTAGRTGATAARGGTPGMVPGQSGTRGTRGAAGSRSAAGTRGSSGGRMVPGTGGTRGKSSKNDQSDESVELMWDDGQEWLGDDETGPEVLG